MAEYEYIEQKTEVSRRAFLGILGAAGAILWSGIYITTDIFQDRNKYIKMRAKGLYKDDTISKIRQSHNNHAVAAMYKEFAQKPLSPLAEKLFHTHYIDRTKLS
jgi:ferredoxin hydrogenase small subunit